jgi:hypothetical protein
LLPGKHTLQLFPPEHGSATQVREQVKDVAADAVEAIYLSQRCSPHGADSSPAKKMDIAESGGYHGQKGIFSWLPAEVSACSRVFAVGLGLGVSC